MPHNLDIEHLVDSAYLRVRMLKYIQKLVYGKTNNN